MRDTLINKQLFDLDAFMNCLILPYPGKLLERLYKDNRLPLMESFGVYVESPVELEKNYSNLHAEDPFNIRWYNSNMQKNLQSFYGLPDNMFALNVTPLTRGVIQEIDLRFSDPIPEVDAKFESLFQLSPGSMLSRLVELQPQIAENIVAELFAQIKFHTGEKNALNDSLDWVLDAKDCEDSEYASQIIDVLACIVLAHKGKGEKISLWITQFQNTINFCCEIAKRTRESILQTLEKSFFFYAYSIDIPIISEEQVNQLEEMMLKNQEATLEILKSGKPDQLDLLNSQKDELGQETDNLNKTLRHLTCMSMHLSSALALAVSITPRKFLLNYSFERTVGIFSFILL